MKHKDFIVSCDKSVKTALKIIERNHKGIVLVENKYKKIIGVLSDGDIRRAILDGVSISSKIKDCCNNNFIFVYDDAPHEQLLKVFDNSLRLVPVLSKKMELIDIISSNDISIPKEKEIYYQSFAPTRVSFGGGGSDLTHFFNNHDGAVINATINLYSHAILIPSNNESVEIHSADIGKNIKAASLDKLLSKKNKDFSLILALLKIISPKFGFRLYINSDFRMGSGLGGSAVVCAAILGCFNETRKDKWDRYELSEIAYQAERIYLGISGGWQDQYASVFGGFNFIEFKASQNSIHSLKINKETIMELESNLFLVDVGGKHNSSDIHDDQKDAMKSKSVTELVKKNVTLCYEIKDHLLRGRLNDFAQSLDQAWNYKRKFSNKISNKKIDKIYNSAIKNGAIGGKLLGAGGGGYFLFYVPPKNRHKFISYINQEDAITLQNFNFVDEGMNSWSTRANY